MPVPPKKILHPARFATWIIGGILLGSIVGFFISLSQPKHFESTTVVAGGFQETGETKLSPTHAKLIFRNLGGSLVSNPQDIHKNTYIRALDGTARITVTSTNRYDAREIAREAARLFRSIEHEQDLTLEPVEIKHFNEEDRSVAEDGTRLRTLLATQASESSIADFLSVPDLAKEGSAPALALLANEDFSRRFNRYQEIAISLGLEGAPGQSITPHLPLLVGPELAMTPADQPIPPSVWYAIIGGGIAGLMGGFLFGCGPAIPLISSPTPARLEPPRPPYTPLAKPESPQDW